MPFNAPIYTDQQREALATAYVDRGIRPARRVAELAGRGELLLDGERVPAFETNPNTVRDCARRLRLRRAGAERSKLATEDPADAVEALRLRLVRLADRELAVLERAKRGKVDAERLRQVARAAREIAAIPGPRDPRPPAPGQRQPGTGAKVGGETRGGLAGKVLKAAAQATPSRVETPTGSTAAQETAQSNRDAHREADARAAADAQQDAQSSAEDGAPGGWARAQVAAVLGEQGEGSGAEG